MSLQLLAIKEIFVNFLNSLLIMMKIFKKILFMLLQLKPQMLLSRSLEMNYLLL
ncbi:hypothetical protein AXF42_Ash015701 [Apostasia shenzhenica]|uniref:Uncharacterized protein n=1 Tax=Apostasia shenzhenica TaxID=1088818 RepID=A0A2H9ZU46_9ASPA|nr:hypothetical protein AXF42_Ash015701 [Apostasia shenzhenica]